MITCRRCGREEVAPPPDVVIHDLCLACESKLAAAKESFDPKYNPFTYPVPPPGERDAK